MKNNQNIIILKKKQTLTQHDRLVLGGPVVFSPQKQNSMRGAHVQDPLMKIGHSESFVGSFFKKILAFVITILLLVNPLLVVAAEEGGDALELFENTPEQIESVSETEIKTESVAEVVPEVVVEEQAVDQDITVEATTTEEIVVENDDVDESAVSEPTTEENEETAPAVEETSSEEQNIASSTDEATSTPTSTASTTESEQSPVDEENGQTVQDESEGTSEAIPEPVDEEMLAITENATTTEETESTVNEEVVTKREEINDQNKYLFSKQQCVKQNEGFYCMQPKEATTTSAALSEEKKVFAEIDTDGDKEIYFDRNGVKEQITNNWYEDDKPAYDTGSGVIVWQALVNDRYQIMSFNTITGEAKQLTGTSYNNTNPHIYKNSIAWQAWVESNWEIMMMDLATTEKQKVQVTNNAWDDMFPQVYEKLISWQGFQDGTWQVFVYNTEDKSTVRVGESDGQYQNPRFMLIMDNKKENGDVATIGYDPATGEVAPLGTTPSPQVPESVPESSSQDQNQAVPVQSVQVTQKTEQEDAAGSGDGDGDELGLSTADTQASTTASSIFSATTTVDVEVSQMPEPLVLGIFSASSTGSSTDDTGIF